MVRESHTRIQSACSTRNRSLSTDSMAEKLFSLELCVMCIFFCHTTFVVMKKKTKFQIHQRVISRPTIPFENADLSLLILCVRFITGNLFKGQETLTSISLLFLPSLIVVQRRQQNPGICFTSSSRCVTGIGHLPLISGSYCYTTIRSLSGFLF